MPAIAPSALYGATRGLDDARLIRQQQAESDLRMRASESALAESQATAPLRRRALETGVKANEQALAIGPLNRQTAELGLQEAQQKFADYQKDRSNAEKVQFQNNLYKNRGIPSIMTGNWAGVADYLTHANADGENYSFTASPDNSAVDFIGDKGGKLHFSDTEDFSLGGLKIPAGDKREQMFKAASVMNDPNNLMAMFKARDEQAAKMAEKKLEHRGVTGKQIDDLTAFGWTHQQISDAVESELTKDRGKLTPEKVKAKLLEIVTKSNVYMSPEKIKDFVDAGMAVFSDEPLPPKTPKPPPLDKKTGKAITDPTKYNMSEVYKLPASRDELVDGIKYDITGEARKYNAKTRGFDKVK